MLVVIDGYNFIFAVPDIEQYVQIGEIEEARERLIALLVKYKVKKKHSIVLVFDSSHDCCDMPSRREVGGIEIVYAMYSKDADTEIKKMIAHCQNPNDTCVVTNDNDIKRYVSKKGSSLMDPRGLYNDIVTTLGWKKTILPKEHDSKYDGPSKSEANYWLKVFKEEGAKDAPIEEVEPVEAEVETGKDGEALDKYTGSATEDTDYWLRFFNEKKSGDK